MMFSNKKKKPGVFPSVKSTQGALIDSMASCKYLGILIDGNFSFISHGDTVQ